LEIPNLLLPPEVIGSGLGVELFDEWVRTREAIATAKDAVADAEETHAGVESQIREHLDRYPEASEAVLEALAQWAHEAGWLEGWIRRTALDFAGVPASDERRAIENRRFMLELEQSEGQDWMNKEARAQALAEQEARANGQ
jgi:Arc/MetJ-type ribon-helix-helix transcriptional regulator